MNTMKKRNATDVSMAPKSRRTLFLLLPTGCFLRELSPRPRGFKKLRLLLQSFRNL